MKRWPIIIGLVAYLIFCVAAWEIYRGPVEEKLEERAAAALAQAKESDPSAMGAEIDYRAMSGTLRGIGDAALAKRLRHKIHRAVGWGSLEIAETGKGGAELPAGSGRVATSEAGARSATFALRPGENPGTWRMSGALPDDDLIDGLVIGTWRDNPAVNWVDAENLRRKDVAEAAWLDPLPEFVGFLIVNLERADLQIGAGKLVIRGKALGDAVKTKILARARIVAGDALQVEDAIETAEISRLIVGKLGGEIWIQGILPDEDLARKLVLAVQGGSPLGPEVDRKDLHISSGAERPEWFARVSATIPDFLGAVEGGFVDISDGGVLIQAGVRSGEARDVALASGRAIAGGEIPFENGGIIILKPPELAVVMAGQKIFLSGLLPSEEFRATLETVIRSYLSTAEIQNEIEVDEEVWDPNWFEAACETVPEFFQITSGLGEGRVEINSESVTAAARLPSDEMKKPVELLFSPLARAGLKVDLTLSVQGQPRLIINRAGKKAKLAGRLRDVETKAKFLNAVSAAFPGAKLEDTVILDDEVAESGWDVMVLELVSVVLSELENPGIDLRPGKVRIEGETDTARSLGLLEARLHEDFGSAFEIETAIKIPERLVAEPTFTLERRDGKWALVGMVANDEEKVALVEMLAAAEGKPELIDELEVTPDVGGSPWIEEIGPVISAMVAAKDPWVSVFRGSVTVEGEFPDNAAKKQLTDACGQLGKLKFEDHSTVKRTSPDVVVPPSSDSGVEPGNPFN